jgi:cell wall-associated NlpC family hydrolase
MRITDFIGIPFTHRGESFKGADCWGFVRLFYKNWLSKYLPDLSDYYSNSDNYKSCGHVYPLAAGFFKEIKKDEFKKYDIALFRIAGVAVHVGIILDKQTFIHCWDKTGSIISRFDDLNFKNKLDSIWRYE